MPTENQKSELFERRIEKLCRVFLTAINEHYHAGPMCRDRCFEALNALAVASAVVINGCDGPDGKAREFFEKAFENQLKEPVP